MLAATDRGSARLDDRPPAPRQAQHDIGDAARSCPSCDEGAHYESVPVDYQRVRFEIYSATADTFVDISLLGKKTYGIPAGMDEGSYLRFWSPYRMARFNYTFTIERTSD